jgi:hypothetical protein
MRLRTEYANGFTEYHRQLDTATVENELRKSGNNSRTSRRAVRPARRAVRPARRPMLHYSAGRKPWPPWPQRRRHRRRSTIPPQRRPKSAPEPCGTACSPSASVSSLHSSSCFSRTLSTRESGRSTPFAGPSVSVLSDVWLSHRPVLERATTQSCSPTPRAATPTLPRPPVEPRSRQRRARRPNDHDHERRRCEKSTSVENLAVAVARAGRRVVLIDSDLSNPHLHRPLISTSGSSKRCNRSARTRILRSRRLEQEDGADRQSRCFRPAGRGGFERTQVLERRRLQRHQAHDDDPVDVGARRDPMAAEDRRGVDEHDGGGTPCTLDDAANGSVEPSSSRPWRADIELGFVVTGGDKSEGYGSQQRCGPSNRRRAGGPRPKPAVLPSAATATVTCGPGVGPRLKPTRAPTRPQARARPICVAPSRRPGPLRHARSQPPRPLGASTS